MTAKEIELRARITKLEGEVQRLKRELSEQQTASEKQIAKLEAELKPHKEQAAFESYLMGPK